MLGSKANKEQSILKRVTQVLISTDDDCLGLHLGFTYEMVVQRRTNNPRNVEGAAMDLACHWWSYSTDTVVQKKKQLLLFCQENNKAHLLGKIEELLQTLGARIESVDRAREPLSRTAIDNLQVTRL